MVIVGEWDGSQWISADVMQELYAIHGETCGSGEDEDTACGCRLFHLLLDIEVKLLEQNRLTPVAGDAASPQSVGEQTRISGQAGEGSAPHPPRA